MDAILSQDFNISGKQYATGTVQSGASESTGIKYDGTTGQQIFPVSVTGLAFLPSSVILSWYDSSAGQYRSGVFKAEGFDGGTIRFVMTGWFNSSFGSAFRMGGGLSVSNGSFRLTANKSGTTVTWYAYE
jgi:hypothetical protein